MDSTTSKIQDEKHDAPEGAKSADAAEPAPSGSVGVLKNHPQDPPSGSAQTIEQALPDTSPLDAVGVGKPAEPVREPQNPSPSLMITHAEPVQSFFGALLAKANAVLRGRKQKKLDKILALAAAKKTITNNDVELYLRVSHATASRYLADLVKSSKLRVIGSPHQPKYELAE
ncbi:MAG: hypothetical protein Q8Q39_01705 [bacterium]|nr:hypothetical protein [bacterium]